MPDPSIPGLAPDRPYFRGFDPSSVPTPCFVVDRAALQYNLDILSGISRDSSADILLALKAFSMFATFDQVRSSLSGTCASGVHEARLGREFVDKQVHSFAPAYNHQDLLQLLELSDHIVFNTPGQWARYSPACLEAHHINPSLRFGLRINPEHSEGTTPLYDPAGPFSRLGTSRQAFTRYLETLGDSPGTASPVDSASSGLVTDSWFRPGGILHGISGLHMHSLCEQDSFALERTVHALEEAWADVLARPEITWLNLGGGHHITKPYYDRSHLTALIHRLSSAYNLKIYLEPGEAIAIHTGILVTQVLDTLWNGMDLAILDTSATAHMPDTLEMPYRPDIWGAGLPGDEAHTYRLGGQTCLAGDILGDYSFPRPLNPGDRLVFDDMAHYTMVKTTTFNGIGLPSLALYDSRTGAVEVVKSFGYTDFKSRLS
ncbi:carboxynorspermidine decarboxylase [Spirochaeta lutea]|uniref:Carboxynorspermidine/carboxyspermidine decarboxylase n=1 Tax=Spirochaeta lutea TaxID=1480694 RepID=A0A098QUB7_9SPIO|nr:carboxynorspermidine decarboxylase [Spirochaeta lutea]KGE71435.1 hypothetical protein DC28_11635 [Spirochaeta lutea]